MNPWQLAQQIRHKLQAVTWPGVGGAVVFGDRGVRVCAGTPTDENVPPGFPWAMVLIGGAASDEDQPDLLLQDFTVAVAVNVGGDRYGEHALLGGSPASMLESGGRGLGEVMERARYAIQALSGADGVRIVVSATNTTGTVNWTSSGTIPLAAKVRISRIAATLECSAQVKRAARIITVSASLPIKAMAEGRTGLCASGAVAWPIICSDNSRRPMPSTARPTSTVLRLCALR